VGVAAIIGAASGRTVVGQAQNPPAQNPPAGGEKPQEPPDPLKFTTDTPIFIINSIKSDKTGDFETAWAGIRAGFAKATDKPELKAFGDTLTKMFKVDLGAQGASQPQQVYILQVDAPSKAHSYNPVKIVYETLLGAGVLTREEADGIYNKLKDSVANINVWPLVKIGS